MMQRAQGVGMNFTGKLSALQYIEVGDDPFVLKQMGSRPEATRISGTKRQGESDKQVRAISVPLL